MHLQIYQDFSVRLHGRFLNINMVAFEDSFSSSIHNVERTGTGVSVRAKRQLLGKTRVTCCAHVIALSHSHHSNTAPRRTERYSLRLQNTHMSFFINVKAADVYIKATVALCMTVIP